MRKHMGRLLAVAIAVTLVTLVSGAIAGTLSALIALGITD